VAPEPYEFCNLQVESLIGDKEDDHFKLGDEPTHQITVTNKNGPECRVVIEIHCKTPGVLVQGKDVWPSGEQTHGGLRSRGKRRWSYEAPLQLNQVGPAQILTIKVYMRGLYEETPPELIGEFDHAIWVS
jgi:hypothetical protein